jgi:hypothetical protein
MITDLAGAIIFSHCICDTREEADRPHAGAERSIPTISQLEGNPINEFKAKTVTFLNPDLYKSCMLETQFHLRR